ncbi:MAG: exosortase/archaeosortase family protein [Chlamydiales bacterium]|nr:exosortase/archaeosortase family protein [Chlamydiia bacterium]MCP5506799.1 exosortase/archaeosortase family protein [Chlamydiales bacterium]
MKKIDYIIATILFFLLLFIWLGDLAWISTSDDTIPILVSLPIFIWLGSPWHFIDENRPLSKIGLCLGALLSLIGVLFGSTLLMAIGWTTLLWTWLKARLEGEPLQKIKKLLIFPLMTFPWITLDFNQIGWWFRLSGAWVTSMILQFFGYEVQQMGTNLVVNGILISIDVACAGINTLQSMLIAGSVINFVYLGNSIRYWWNIPVLVAISWIANTLRIIAICFAALAMGPEFAVDLFHNWGGWAVLVLMFGLCWAVISIQEPNSKNNNNY